MFVLVYSVARHKGQWLMCIRACRLWAKGEEQAHEELMAWSYNHTLGLEDGSSGVLPLGQAPPRARPCTVLFHPRYHLAFVDNAIGPSQSVIQALGGMCPSNVTVAATDVRCQLLGLQT